LIDDDSTPLTTHQHDENDDDADENVKIDCCTTVGAVLPLPSIVYNYFFHTLTVIGIVIIMLEAAVEYTRGRTKEQLPEQEPILQQRQW
jgi:hypothetical protein